MEIIFIYIKSRASRFCKPLFGPSVAPSVSKSFEMNIFALYFTFLNIRGDTGLWRLLLQGSFLLTVQLFVKMPTHATWVL